MLVLTFVLANAADMKVATKKLSSYDCNEFSFVSIIGSKLFDEIDSSFGKAYIAKDGRYKIEIGPDIYLFDGDTLYTYFFDNNQVIIEKPDSGNVVADEISFVVKLDEWYDSQALKQKNCFKLVKKENVSGDIPDSMTITLNGRNSTIEMIEYFDINKDLNRIKIIKQQGDSTCERSHFRPVFPDSVEKVRI